LQADCLAGVWANRAQVETTSKIGHQKFFAWRIYIRLLCIPAQQIEVANNSASNQNNAGGELRDPGNNALEDVVRGLADMVDQLHRDPATPTGQGKGETPVTFTPLWLCSEASCHSAGESPANRRVQSLL